MDESLDQLVQRARLASPNDRIDLRDAIASHGVSAIESMAEWFADPVLTRFAVRVVGRVADLGLREEAIRAFVQAREEATSDQRADIDSELRRLGLSARSMGVAHSSPTWTVDSSVPGWMMRTNRNLTGWLWAEVIAGRLRQGWGYQPKQDLPILLGRRDRGEPLDRDDDWAMPNRRMLSDQPDGMQIGDAVFTPHLPQPWHWSVLRIVGPYHYQIDAIQQDYGHILPVEILKAGIPDGDLTPALQSVRRYPARLRRLTREAYEDLQRVVADLPEHGEGRRA